MKQIETYIGIDNILVTVLPHLFCRWIHLVSLMQDETHVFGQPGISTSKHQNSWLLLRNEHVEKSGEIFIGLEPIKVTVIILSRVWSREWDHDRANWCISDGLWISFIPNITFQKDKWMRPGIKSIFSQRDVTHQYSLVQYSSFLIGNRSSGIVGYEWCWNKR